MLSHAFERLPDTTRLTIPVMSPQLPSADRLLPYLRRIDDSRTYAKFGPLVLEREALAARLAPSPGGSATASSGAAALARAVLVAEGRSSQEPPLIQRGVMREYAWSHPSKK